jgi:hypothetical protein
MRIPFPDKPIHYTPLTEGAGARKAVECNEMSVSGQEHLAGMLSTPPSDTRSKPLGENIRDKDAVRAIMGRAENTNDMSAVYNEGPVEDRRLGP